VGTKVPGRELSGRVSSREQKFQGTKVPHLELSLPGANGLGGEKSIIPAIGFLKVAFPVTAYSPFLKQLRNS